MADEQAGKPPAELLAAADLLPTLYAELRRLAGALSARLPPGQTLQPTALVHEAYLKLVRDQDPGWEGRRHFFGAAAQAMREILIDQARRKASVKHGGHGRRIELTEGLALIEPPTDDLLALDEAIQRLQAEEPRLGEIVLLRYYAGLSVEETAEVVGQESLHRGAEVRVVRAGGPQQGLLFGQGQVGRLVEQGPQAGAAVLSHGPPPSRRGAHRDATARRARPATRTWRRSSCSATTPG